jgi:sec-independent protein translocase protein TatB
MNEASSSFEKDWASIGTSLDGSASSAGTSTYEPLASPPPEYRHPRKKWRLKRGATPQWYKQRQGIRTNAQSGAARVARFRPPGLKAPR